MELLKGKELSQKFKSDFYSRVENLEKKPTLCIILINQDHASEIYVRNKIQYCQDIDIEPVLVRMENPSENELLELIDNKNKDIFTNGIIVQLPLPEGISENKVINKINPIKDVDGFHPSNIGGIHMNNCNFIPATPLGILFLLKEYEIPTMGKNCTIIGRSNIVGLPMALLMQRPNYPGDCTVTICHEYSKDLTENTKNADIIITATGNINLITSDMVKEGVVIFDVGINRIEDKSKRKGYRIVGDVDFENVSLKSSYITPVPGGVGSMTITALVYNTIKAYNLQHNLI